jgi:hypothetical protein
MIITLKILLAATLLLAPAVATEAGVRSLIEAGRLPIAPSSDQRADVGLANLVRLGKPDVLILGTSAVRNAIQPDVLEQLIKEETGRDVDVQGIAQSAMSLRAQRLLVRGLAGLDLLPDVVITGLTPISLTGDHNDGDWFLQSALGQLWDECAQTDGVDDLGASLDCWLGQESAAWRWRGRPGRLVHAAEKGMPKSIVVKGRRLKENGWTAAKAVTPKELRKELPGTLARLQEQIVTPASIVIEFAELMRQLRDREVQVVPVTMPYAGLLEDALVARNPDWEQQRLDGVELFEAYGEIDIIDVDGYGDWVDGGSFHDLRHLSRDGAGPFTRQLWEIPEFKARVLEGLGSVD